LVFSLFYFKGFIIFVFLLESYINWRQHKRLQGRKMPALLPSLGVDEEKFLKSQAYGLDKRCDSCPCILYQFIVYFVCLGSYSIRLNDPAPSVLLLNSFSSLSPLERSPLVMFGCGTLQNTTLHGSRMPLGILRHQTQQQLRYSLPCSFQSPLYWDYPRAFTPRL
jgi:hypothetical protein